MKWLKFWNDKSAQNVTPHKESGQAKCWNTPSAETPQGDPEPLFLASQKQMRRSQIKPINLSPQMLINSWLCFRGKLTKCKSKMVHDQRSADSVIKLISFNKVGQSLYGLLVHVQAFARSVSSFMKQL